MSKIAEFFKRLLEIHMLFWMLSFRRFDVLPLFVAIIIAVGATDYLTNQKIAGATLSIALQFILYFLAFLFCYVWQEFRKRLIENANKMVCLSLCISVLAGLFAFLIKFVIIAPPLADNIGAFIARLINELKFLFAWDSRYSLATILFVLAYLVILLNTFYVVGRKKIRRELASAKIVPLLVSIAMSLIGTFLVLWPIFDMYG